jgi:hypothetical protein
MLNTPIVLLLGTVVVFIIGIGSGWYLTNSNIDVTKSEIQIAVAALVATVWLIAVVAEILIPAYTVNLLIHGIMGVVVGYLFSEDGLTINIGGTN